jgi:hypothetical protein
MGEDCAICSLELLADVVIPEVVHEADARFHFDCVKDWVLQKSGWRVPCPLCRRIIRYLSPEAAGGGEWGLLFHSNYTLNLSLCPTSTMKWVTC